MEMRGELFLSLFSGLEKRRRLEGRGKYGSMYVLARDG